MSLCDKMFNINNLNTESCIKKAIINTKENLNNLTDERTCYIYSSYIYEELKQMGVMVKLLNTEKIENAYVHYFNVAIKDEYSIYIIDLNFKQFNYEFEFKELLEKGYQLVDYNLANKYLEIVTQKKNLESSFKELFFDSRGISK